MAVTVALATVCVLALVPLARVAIAEGRLRRRARRRGGDLMEAMLRERLR
jgi:hypothetical protein